MKGINKQVKFFFGSYLGLAGILIGLISLATVFMSNNVSTIVALCSFIFILLCIGFYIIHILYKISSLHGCIVENGFTSKANFIKYEQLTDTEINYESYKTIQVKEPFLTEIEWPFNWSGSELPEITSKLQTVHNVLKVNDPSQYDKAILVFKNTILHNQSTVLHFHARCKDTDNSAGPFINSRIINHTDLLIFRVILRNKSDSYITKARVERIKNNSVTTVATELISEVSFDKDTKSYEYSILAPQVGYNYSITWVK